MKISNLVGILLLLFGVGAGVFLVQQVQDYREKAAKPDKYKVCHKTGSAENPYVTIEIDDNALEAHINHGDSLGECPGNGGADDGGSSGGDSTGGTSVTSTGNSSSGSDSSSDSSSGESSGVQIITETKYVYLNPGTLEFYVKFLGVDQKREDKSIRVEMRKEDQEVHIYEDVPVTANSTGVYKGTIREVPQGTYDIYIKGVNYLQASFEDVKIQRGFNRWYWNTSELVPGDLDSDNDLDIDDIAIFLAKYDQEEQEVDLESTYYDANFDGKINIKDLDLILNNYSKLIKEGEN